MDDLIASIPSIPAENGKFVLYGILIVAALFFAGVAWVKLGLPRPNLGRRQPTRWL